MRFYRISILALLPIFLFNVLYGQQRVVDSLANKLDYVIGKERVKVLNELADIYPKINIQKAIFYAQEGIKLAETIHYEKGLAGCYGSLGFAYINLDNVKAEQYTNKALNIRRKIKDKSGIASSLNVLGVLNYYEGDYLKSIEYHLDALKRREAIGNPNKIAISYNNIALVNIALENYDTALDYLQKSLKIRTEMGNIGSIAIVKVNIGKIQAQMGNTDEALKTFFETLTLNRQLGNYNSEANSYQNIASIYKTLNQNSKAIDYYDSSLATYYKIKEKNGIANSENGLAEVYKNDKQYDLAIKHAKIALYQANQINSFENRLKAFQTLFFSFDQKKEYQKAYEYLKQYQTAYEKSNNNGKIKKLAKIELNYKLENLQKIQEIQLNNQRAYIYLLVLVVISGAIILILVSKSSKNKKRANRELNIVNSKLYEVNKTKDKFLSIIAHDLRGPYQSTLGLSQFLSDNLDVIEKNDLQEGIKNLHSSLNNQYNLLTDLLKWVELQAGGFNLNTEKIELYGIVDDVIALLGLSAKKKNITLINNVNPNIFVSADKNMIHLVLRNLISNSIKFTPQNGIVEIKTHHKKPMVEICVADNGIGISSDDFIKLFKIDVHYTNKGTSNEEGSGLGLILCKEIIEKHNGSIWVESKVGKGSKFYFTMPVSH